MQKDLVSNLKSVISVKPSAITANTTGTTVDTQGFHSGMVEFNFGAITDGTFTPSLLHSVDGTTFTDAGTDGFLQGTFSAVLNGTGATATQKAGYTGPNRYLAALLTKSGSTTTGGLVAANILLGDAEVAPV